MVCLRLKRHVLNGFIFSDYYVMFEKNEKKKNDRIVNIDKEKYEINSLHVYSCYDFICKEIFVIRLSKNQYKSTVYTHNSYNM
jgi:predicted membrane protein